MPSHNGLPCYCGVMQSLTKFYDGQNVAVGGAIVSATKELDENMRLFSNVNGNILGPQNAFYILQAVKVHFENLYTTNGVGICMVLTHTHRFVLLADDGFEI